MEEWLSKKYPPDTEVAIEVSVELLRKSFNKYENIPCKVIFGSIVRECVVACGHFLKLQSSLASKSGNVNLLDYIPKLIPRSGKQISLVTYQSQHTPNEYNFMGKKENFKYYKLDNSEKSQKLDLEKFYKTGELIQSNFLKEKALCIGLYRPKTEPYDNEILFSDEESFTELYHLFKAIRKQINPFIPPPVWIHIASAESTCTVSRAIGEFSQLDRNRLKRHLYSLNYGPVVPVPSYLAKYVLNTYSDGDNSVNWLRTPESCEGCNIETVPSLNPPKDKSPIFSPGDHAFEGKTYQAALKENIGRIRKFLKEGGKL